MLDDWKVEVFDVAPKKNGTPNPYTGIAIDPDGLTQSLFTMKLTNNVTGKVLERADLIGRPSKEALIKYAQDVINNIEVNALVQKTNGAPSPLVGVLDIKIKETVDERTDLQKAEQAFRAAENDHSTFSMLVERLRASGVPDIQMTDLDTRVMEKLTIRSETAIVLAAAILA